MHNILYSEIVVHIQWGEIVSNNFILLSIMKYVGIIFSTIYILKIPDIFF